MDNNLTLYDEENNHIPVFWTYNTNTAKYVLVINNKIYARATTLYGVRRKIEEYKKFNKLSLTPYKQK